MRILSGAGLITALTVRFTPQIAPADVPSIATQVRVASSIALANGTLSMPR